MSVLMRSREVRAGWGWLSNEPGPGAGGLEESASGAVEGSSVLEVFARDSQSGGGGEESVRMPSARWVARTCARLHAAFASG